MTMTAFSTTHTRLADLLRKHFPSFMRFLAVGGIGLTTDLAVFHLAEAVGLAWLLARLLSLSVATLVTWRLNRRFTFGASGRRQTEEGLRYALVTVFAQGINYVLFALLAAGPLEDHKSLAILVGAGVAAFFSFAGHALFSFAALRPVKEA